MPLLWRYLLKRYIVLFSLALSTFIGMLLVIRFQEIAIFASSGSNAKFVILYTFYQIPYILPFAIPISGLISALILFKNLSSRHEITAFRAAGLSLKQLLAPILCLAVLFCFVNFIMASEIAPRCKAKSKDLIYKAANSNPLFIFQKGSPIRIKDAHIHVGGVRSNRTTDDLCIVAKNNSENRLSLIIAKKLSLKGSSLVGKNVSIISSFNTHNLELPDHLIIENQTTMETQAENISQILQSAEWHRHNECLGLRMLLAKIRTEHHIGSYNEVVKRLSLSIAPFTLMSLGAIFGMNIGRRQNRKTILMVSFMTVFYLMSFLAARSVKTSLALSSSLYLVPHLFLLLFSGMYFRKINLGVE